jgi:hypothetical protein
MRAAAGRASEIASLVRSRVSHLSIGDGTSTERLKTGAQPIVNGGQSSARRVFRPTDQGPYRRFAHSPFRLTRAAAGSFHLGKRNHFSLQSSNGGVLGERAMSNVSAGPAPEYRVK